MHLLILKRGATGDVVRTTALLRRFDCPVTWVTEDRNVDLLRGLPGDVECVPWSDRDGIAAREFDLAINLEDDVETGAFLKTLRTGKVFGAYLNDKGDVAYTDDAKPWFDMSLISVFGRQQADLLKLKNRKTYQELIFGSLGFQFQGEKYVLPVPAKTDLSGDIAISPVAGAVWPMKNWACYDALKSRLEADGFRVNVLPKRPTMLEHLGDVANHRLLVSGDSLPMHLAMGCGVRCVTLFTCTSPWEIYDYGIQTQIVSPRLEEFFYKRGMDPAATTAIPLDEVHAAVMHQLKLAVA
ncbi:MAG: glycosyltransferase family 9 protein [Chthoniobacteraceae bacterium]